MLGRTANGVYWMYRYLERAENMARLLDAGFRMALTRDARDARDEWRSIILTCGQQQAYEASQDDYSAGNVINFMLRGRDNPLDVRTIIESARNNARMVRASLTREVWEAVNESWIALNDLLSRRVTEANLKTVLDALRNQSQLVRGATVGSMLRNDIYYFARIGTYLERADNTARILDVKYFVLLPAVSYVGSSLDNVQWENVLRSVSGERAYRWLNAGVLDPRGIAEFLILDQRFPRSLSFCHAELRANLLALSREYGVDMPAHTLVRQIGVNLLGQRIETIFEQGLHEFIGQFLARNNELAGQIEADYRFID